MQIVSAYVHNPLAISGFAHPGDGLRSIVSPIRLPAWLKNMPGIQIVNIE